MTTLTESDIEHAALGWQEAYVPDIDPGTPNVERGDYG